MKKSLLILGLLICTLANYAQQAGTFKDPRDGKVYKTIKIGTLTWFAENLAYKPSKGNYWAYDNNNSNVAKYGYLYDWEIAKTICPKGWHLPSDAEWTVLANYLGGENEAGSKMKATSSWDSPNTGATNESGFNALPGDSRSKDGLFYDIGKSAYFWSSTLVDSDNVWSRSLFYFSGSIIRGKSSRMLGFSIRCTKD